MKTVLVLLAGTVPFMSFVAERRVAADLRRRRSRHRLPLLQHRPPEHHPPEEHRGTGEQPPLQGVRQVAPPADAVGAARPAPRPAPARRAEDRAARRAARGSRRTARPRGRAARRARSRWRRTAAAPHRRRPVRRPVGPSSERCSSPVISSSPRGGAVGGGPGVLRPSRAPPGRTPRGGPQRSTRRGTRCGRHRARCGRRRASVRSASRSCRSPSPGGRRAVGSSRPPGRLSAIERHRAPGSPAATPWSALSSKAPSCHRPSQVNETRTATSSRCQASHRGCSANRVTAPR